MGRSTDYGQFELFLEYSLFEWNYIGYLKCISSSVLFFHLSRRHYRLKDTQFQRDTKKIYEKKQTINIKKAEIPFRESPIAD